MNTLKRLIVLLSVAGSVLAPLQAMNPAADYPAHEKAEAEREEAHQQRLAEEKEMEGFLNHKHAMEKKAREAREANAARKFKEKVDAENDASAQVRYEAMPRLKKLQFGLFKLAHTSKNAVTDAAQKIRETTYTAYLQAKDLAGQGAGYLNKKGTQAYVWAADNPYHAGAGAAVLVATVALGVWAYKRWFAPKNRA